jgi:hypothetical protein
MSATTHTRVLLSTADRQVEGFTSLASARTSFEDSLYEAIFFHNTGVIPDILPLSLLRCTRAKRKRVPRIASALAEGWVIPSFRGRCKSFNSSPESHIRTRDSRACTGTSIYGKSLGFSTREE